MKLQIFEEKISKRLLNKREYVYAIGGEDTQEHTCGPAFYSRASSKWRLQTIFLNGFPTTKSEFRPSSEDARE